MARLILKSPYLKPNSKRSAGGYLKYIATREGVVPVQDTPQRDVYLKYISERPGAVRIGNNGLFSDEGAPIVLSKIQKEMNESQSNIWTHIISLHREDAERLGYNTPGAWMHLLRAQRNMIAQQMKIAPENFRWYAAFHNEGHHPHVHMMAYSIVPNEAHLSKKGIETIKSNLAREIFQQDLLQIYEKQTEVRDELRQESRERIHQIVEELNLGSFDNPELRLMLVQLSEKLSRSKGKKVYGYLSANTKKLVDDIVATLASDERIQKLYKLWYAQKEDVLRTYTDTFPERIPLEQNKEFKAIRNAVIEAALKLYIPQEETPLSAPCAPRVPVVAPAPKPVPAQAARALLQALAAMLRDSSEQLYQKHQRIDKKQRQKIEEKKQAQGLRTSNIDVPQM